MTTRKSTAKTDLTPKEEEFAALLAKGMSAVDAYQQAYQPKTANRRTITRHAHDTKRRPKVAARILALKAPALAKAELTVERTLREVARIAYFDPRKVYRDDGTLKRPDEWDDDTAAMISSIEVEELFEGKGDDRKPIGHLRKVKFADKNAGLDKAMKHLGLYEKDNQQQTESLVLRISAAQPVK